MDAEGRNVMAPPRANVASSFTVIKGSMIEETYAAFGAWDPDASKRENLDRLRAENSIGAPTTTWLRDVAKVLNRRFDPEGRDRSLVLLAKSNLPLDEWRPILLWHMTRDEFLLRDFLQHWLFSAYEDGSYQVKPEDLREYLTQISERGGVTEHVWTDATLNRVAAGLLRSAADFGLLTGGVTKHFATYHLPDRAFLYLLHALRDDGLSPGRIVESPDWRMYLMRRTDVERELLRLHQFRKLHYEVAGSLVQLSLPCETAAEYAQEMVG